MTQEPTTCTMVVLTVGEHDHPSEFSMSIGDPVVTRKGQVTIPIEIRRSLGLKRGDRVTFVQENGSARLQKAPSLVEQTAGMLSKYALDHVPTDEEMNEAIELAIVEDTMFKGAF